MDEYRYFYDSLKAIGGMWTGDATYVLHKYLKQHDRRMLDRLITRFGMGDGLRIDELNGPRTAKYSAPLPGHMLEQYQDIWVKGRLVAPGVRECAARYEAIKPVFSAYKRPFSVLDIGSNLGYFSIRISEDFDATCACFEDIYTEWLRQVLEANETRSVYALNHRVGLDTLRQLGECEQFDVVLALSVLHHIDAPAGEVVDALRRLGTKVVLELPTEDRACGLERRDAARDLDIGGFTILGYGQSHLEGPSRPIVLLDGDEPALSKGYLAAPVPCAPVTLRLTDEEAVVTKGDISRPFLPGFNAHNFFYLNGFYPPPSIIAERFGAAKRPEVHADLAWWNVVLSSGDAHVIDDEDNSVHGFDDDVQFGLMTSIARSLDGAPVHDGPLHFVQGNEECRYLAGGWHDPEPHMTWSAGPVGILAIPGRRAVAHATLRARVHMPPVEQDDGCTVRFRVNGVDIALVSMEGSWSQEVTLAVPAETWNLSVPAIVELTASACIVPAEVLESPDLRRIGVGISECTIEIDCPPNRPTVTTAPAPSAP